MPLNKKGQPHLLAVDLGCGTGQNSRRLAPHFQEVVGIDVSESQIEEAKAVQVSQMSFTGQCGHCVCSYALLGLLQSDLNCLSFHLHTMLLLPLSIVTDQ